MWVNLWFPVYLSSFQPLELADLSVNSVPFRFSFPFNYAIVLTFRQPFQSFSRFWFLFKTQTVFFSSGIWRLLFAFYIWDGWIWAEDSSLNLKRIKKNHLRSATFQLNPKMRIELNWFLFQFFASFAEHGTKCFLNLSLHLLFEIIFLPQPPHPLCRRLSKNLLSLFCCLFLILETKGKNIFKSFFFSSVRGKKFFYPLNITNANLFSLSKNRPRKSRDFIFATYL